ncbi:Sporulation kinase A [bioreactor metagenome]|uniref:Sporulation kinase A n=1 Tax=bioreactor metagenome TaxID=1076179 RepID=A0A644ZE63_9ZZZZ
MEIQRLDKLDLIGKMAAGIGHEIRNPLTTVRGYLQFISSKEHFKEYADKFNLMISELDRSNMIISEFLALSKNKVSRLELNDLNVIVLAIYPLLEVDALSENKIINLELDRSIPTINLDESEIRQLIINLVRNGLEAMPYKGVLTIKTRHDNQHVMLVIQDCGSGIPQNIIDQIGTPFFTTKDNGTGLGLSVCYSIAARHKALIDFKTDKSGTAFTVSFNI